MEEIGRKKRLTAVKRSDTELDLRNVMLERKHIITFWGRRIHNQTAWRWILIKECQKRGQFR